MYIFFLTCISFIDILLVYYAEKDPITFMSNPVYGPFKGSVTILPNGTFSYTSTAGEPDLFVFQVCDGNQLECSDGCNQGVVYINSAGCAQFLANGEDTEACSGTGENMKLLTFRYTGQDCSASFHRQDNGMVTCSGDPAFAPVVYVTAEADQIYISDLEVMLNETFTIDAASIGENKLKDFMTVYLKDAQGQILQTITFNTSGYQPLGVDDQFASIILEGYLLKNNTVCGNPDLENRNIIDCRIETGGHPKLLTFRYTGEDCSASNHSQSSNQVDCSGDPAFAPLVYITAKGKGNVTFFTDLEVPLNGTFTIDAVRAGLSHLKKTTTFYIKNVQGQLLQEVEFNTSGQQPLGVDNQFGSLVLEGYYSKNNLTCGNPDLENRGAIDCRIEAGDMPRLLTFRYTGQDCSASNPEQSSSQVDCSGDPALAPFVYVTAISNGNKYYAVNQEVALDGTFSINALDVGEAALAPSTTIYLMNSNGATLQTIQLHTSDLEPLRLTDQFGSLVLEGYLAGNESPCGQPEIPSTDGDACYTTNSEPQILTLQYTGAGCIQTDHHQRPDLVSCIGDPGDAPFVYVTVQSGNNVFFRDLQVPLNSYFDIDAETIGKDKLPESLLIDLKDNLGNILQEIEFHTSCSEPLGVGDQFGALQLRGYMTRHGALSGDTPVSMMCNPTAYCTASGKRSAIGLIYLGSYTTTVSAYSGIGNGNDDDDDGGDLSFGSYQQVNPGDFIVFSSFYQQINEFNRFVLRWAGNQVVELPVETFEEIIDSIYGDFKVVHQLDRYGNDCRVPYSSCMEVNRQCGEGEVAPLVQDAPTLSNTRLPDDLFMENSQEKDVKIYPNPTLDIAYIDLSRYSGQAVEIELYNSVSLLVKRIKLDGANSTPLELKLDELPVGLYNVIGHPEADSPVSKKLVIVNK